MPLMRVSALNGISSTPAPLTLGAAGAGPAEAADGRKGPAVTGEPTGDRALRSPRTEKQRAGTLAAGARRQAKRDSR